MELSRKDIVRYRQILLKTFKAFSDLCDENGLEWYMAFGSAIGTVRHKGFIPWDDDIDVFMPRADYERFIGLKVHGYSIVGPRVEGDPSRYPFPYTKFCDGSSTIWERQLYPCVFGVFIDVFPLDEAFSDSRQTEAFRKAYRLNFRNYRRSLRLYQPGECRRRLRKGDFAGAVKVFLDEFRYLPKSERYMQEYLRLEHMLAQRAVQADGTADGGSARCASDCDYVVYGTNDDYWGVTMPRTWFADTIEMPFEDTKAKMPSGYDEMLRTFYGNYMELPRQEQRISNHFHYFVDLERAMGLDEVTEILP